MKPGNMLGDVSRIWRGCPHQRTQRNTYKLEMLRREAEIPRREWKLSASTKLSSKLRECLSDLINDPHIYEPSS